MARNSGNDGLKAVGAAVAIVMLSLLGGMTAAVIADDLKRESDRWRNASACPQCGHGGAPRPALTAADSPPASLFGGRT